MWVQVGDLGVLKGKSLVGLEICSAISGLEIRAIGGLMGRRSTSITGGRPMDVHISSKILSISLSEAGLGNQVDKCDAENETRLDLIPRPPSATQ